MKTDFYKIECEILVVLSDFKPYNQNQIADLIGTHEKSTDRVHVSRCLKKIIPYLKRVPNDLEELGKKWALKQDIETIRQIIEKYPSLKSDFQKNDIILEMVVNYQTWLISPNKPYGAALKYDLLTKLQLSFTFFKTCIMTSPEALQNHAIDICNLSETQLERVFFNKSKKLNNPDYDLEDYIEPQWQEMSNALFETCVCTDILNGNQSKGAIEYIQKMKNKNFEIRYMNPEEKKKWINNIKF